MLQAEEAVRNASAEASKAHDDLQTRLQVLQAELDAVKGDCAAAIKVCQVPCFALYELCRGACRCRHTAMHAWPQQAALTASAGLKQILLMWQSQAELEKELQAAKQAAEAQAATHALALAEQEARLCDQTEQQAAQSKAGMASLTAQVEPGCLHSHE